MKVKTTVELKFDHAYTGYRALTFNDSDQNEVGINTSNPGSTLEVNGNFRPTYYYPHAPTSQTSSNNNNYWKLGNMYLPGPYGAEIVMHGAKPGYSSGGTNVGKLTILLRGGTNASLLDAVFYAEGDTSSVPSQSVRYVPNGNYEFEIYVQLGNYTSTSHTVVTGGSWTENVVNTGSTSAPANSVGIPAELSTWLGPNQVMKQTTTETTINETSNDHNFRVESNASTHGLYLDADDDTLCFFTGTTSSSLPSGGNFKRDGQNNGWMDIGHTTAAGDGFSYIQFMYNSGRIGQAVQSGTTGITYQTTSDYRLKESAVAITSATERVKQLNPIRFNFISEPDRTIDGFLAHEVQAVVPEAVSGTKDEVDSSGRPEYQGLDTSRLVPVLVATIKELEARITALENA